MNRHEKAIAKYLQSPADSPRPQADQQRHFVYLLTYIGELFVQGYKLIEVFSQVLLFSLMECQDIESQKRVKMELPARFKVVLWQMDSSNVFEGEKRRTLYNSMMRVGSWLSDPQYQIIYLQTGRYSILDAKQLQLASVPPECKQFYTKIGWIQQRNGFRPMQQKQQGINLHQLVQIFLKGCGQARNPKVMKHLQRHEKYVYDLFKVVNTVCYIIGKEIMENDYQVISVEKWMRKATLKRFKRLDLVLRNQERCCIIDWKFSRIEAKEKIRGNGIGKKNKVYYQLACKDFRTNIQLKFYCIHEQQVNYNYHFYTCATYDHQVDQVQLDTDPAYLDIVSSDDDQEDEDGQVQPKRRQIDRVISQLLQEQVLDAAKKEDTQKAIQNFQYSQDEIFISDRPFAVENQGQNIQESKLPQQSIAQKKIRLIEDGKILMNEIEKQKQTDKIESKSSQRKQKIKQNKLKQSKLCQIDLCSDEQKWIQIDSQ